MHISIIDDEKILSSKILKKIENNGYSASAFCGYQDFMKNANANSDLYIIDLSLGDGSGFDIIDWLRKEKHSLAPIIIMSGYADSQNVIYGLDIGADDYITKPFVPDELIARIKAILRRPRTTMIAPVVKYKNIAFNTATREAKIGNKPVYLTRNETLVVEMFLVNQKKIISRERLISSVWGWTGLGDVSDNTINVTISNIRKKLEGSFIPKTIYNQGYILE